MNHESLKQLAADMSLEEKINQLLQLSGNFYGEGIITGPAGDLGIDESCVKQAGSCLSIIGAAELKRIQTECMKEQKHHIPMMFMCDIINGYRTVYPIPLAQGCTFDPELSKECAAMAAAEAAASGLHATFAPMADLVRDARWGRVMESTGEDTFLNGQFAKAMVEGFQGEKLSDKGKIAACIKHFAAYGAPAAGRDYNNIELSERTFREDYLPAYQAAVDAGCAMVMTSFNSHNRIPCSGNKELLQTVLREEMGFDGVLISDWAALKELIAHGFAKEEEEAAQIGMECGVDIDMMTNVYASHLQKLVEEGKVSEYLVEQAVIRVLEMKNKLGLFENPYKDADEEAEKELILCDEHRKLSKKCAEESFVLLKNEAMLPLQLDDQKIAVIGPYGDEKCISGAWSFFAKDQDSVTIKEAAVRKFGEGKIAFAKGCEILNEGQRLMSFRETSANEVTQEEAARELEKAVSLARSSDIVVMAIGEHRNFTGEGASSAFISVPEIQMNLLRRVYEVNQNIVVVLFNGRPLDLREVSTMSKAVLDVWMPGTEGGTAIIETLFGGNNPSGKLSMSFPYCVGQVPVHYNEFSTGRPFTGTDYREGRFFSAYLDIPNQPLYPFGHGLSYTEFTYSDVKLDRTEMKKEENIHASVTVTNSGKATGTEIVQMYLRDVVGSVIRPVRELKGFERVTLEPRESRNVEFTIDNEMLKFYGITMEYDSEPGSFQIFIGTDSTTQNAAEFSLIS